jgi:DNA polymerase-1
MADKEIEKRLIIIDGYSLVFRAYHSMPALSRQDGTPVGAVYGFVSMMLRLLSDIKATHIVMVFDTGGKTFRHELYPQYKANRPPAPEDLIPQFPLMRFAAQALNIHILEQQGYEADDIIATLAERALANKEEVLIISSDKDLMQLINGHTKMYDAVKAKIIGAKEVQEKFGVFPEKMLDLLSMIGDTADNIPGIPGIGPKTAALLLEKYGTLDSILANTANIKQEKRRQSIEQSREIVKLSKQLITLHKDVKLSVTLDDLKAQGVDPKKLLAFLEEQNFRSLVARVKKDFNVTEEQEQVTRRKSPAASIIIVNDRSELENITLLVKQSGKAVFYIQNNFTHNEYIKNSQDIAGIGITVNENNSFYVPFVDKESSNHHSLFAPNGQMQHVSFAEFILAFSELFADSSVLKIMYDHKRFLHLIAEVKKPILTTTEDVMIMSYALGCSMVNTEFKHLISHFLNQHDILLDLGGITKSRAAFNDLDLYSIANYVVKKTSWLDQLYRTIKDQLASEHLVSIYEKIDRPLSEIVYEMEESGIKVNPIILRSLSDEFDSKLQVLEKEIFKIAGHEFNIASPKQLSDVLFNKMGIDAGKKSKSGALSTGVEVLELLQQQGHPIADALIEWRRFYKLKNTYTDTLVKQINPKTGRVHTNFAIAATSTGRFSSNDPNLQNIPIRSEWGNKIRAAFVAKSGYKLLSVDYSQIELRILAHRANIEGLKKAFAEGKDIHSTTASEVFHVDLDKVNSNLRRQAKAINFGIIYGISAFGLAKNLGIDRSEAGEYIKRYFEEYPGILEYMEQVKTFARTHGYVETIFGRRCYTPHINSSNATLKSFAERAAINAPLQGSVADIIKKAMIKVARELKTSDFDVKMLLQVHDELIFEVKESDLEKSIVLIKRLMESVSKLDILLTVDSHYGDSWVRT